MDLKNAVPVLFVKDAVKARDFYADVLGMTVVADFGGMNFIFKEGFALWQPMEENIIPRKLGSGNINDPDSVSRFELCFETSDIDAVYDAVKGAGVKFLHEMNVELWGQRTIRFYDPDGHLVEVGEETPAFLRRIYDEVKSVEETARRTFMEPDMVRQYLGL